VTLQSHAHIFHWKWNQMEDEHGIASMTTAKGK